MEMADDLFVLCHHLNQLVRCILGVAGHKPKAEIPLQIGHGIDQFGETCAVQIPSVGVHVLPQEGNILGAAGDQLPCLGEDSLRCTASFPSAGIGHNAV